METLDLSTMSAQEKANLLRQLNKEAKSDRLAKREAYEQLKEDFLKSVEDKVTEQKDSIEAFHEWLETEAEAFKSVMNEYCMLRHEGQGSVTITGKEFRLQVAQNKVKQFDERAEAAATRLIDYLKAYAEEKGTDDAMYQLAMTLLERNKQGNLDYKSISKLYEMEDKFDGEYSEIMQLFRESNVVTNTVMNFYFYRKDDMGVWRRMEISFCRL